MFNISGCVPKRPNDIVYLVQANKINTSAYLHSTGITHQACFILAEHDKNICWLKWWETILLAPTTFWKIILKIVDGVICGRPLLYWHKVGSAWGRQYPPYSDTWSRYLSELFVFGPDAALTLWRAHHSPGLSRGEAVAVVTSPLPVMAPSPSWVTSGSGGSGIPELYHTLWMILSSRCFYCDVKMTNNAALRRWVASDHWVWMWQSISTIYFAFRMITNWEFLHWTFWFSAMYFSNLNQI